MIENAHFLDHFKNAWVLQISGSQEFLQVETDDLIAFDGEGNILGINRRAREELTSNRKKVPTRIEDLFEVGVDQLIEFGARNQQMLRLRVVNSKSNFFARVRPPENKLQGNGFATPIQRRVELAPQKSDPAPKIVKQIAMRSPELAPAANLSARTTSAQETSERDRLVTALRLHKWQILATAKSLGMARATMYRKMAKHQIVSPNKAEP